MADHTRLAAAGLFLALTLAAVPALLPLNLAGADPRQHTQAAPPPATVVHLRVGELAVPPTEYDSGRVPEGVLRYAVSEAAPRAHTVAAGETLWRISRDAGVGVGALAAANHLTLGATLHPGQVLSIPPLDPSAEVGPAQTHEVEPGETLWGIARLAGVRVESLAAANHLSLDTILHPGQTLSLPAGGGRASAAGRRGSLAAAGPALRLAPEPLFMGDALSLVSPSDGKITSRFGWRIHPIFGTREFHTGVDIANHIGTPVRAAEAGMVRFVGWMAGYGRLIVVAHGGGVETSYSHLSTMLVTLGQRVVRGQVLGGMGNTGWSTGPHLLFEVRRNGVPMDPIPFLQGLRRAAADMASAVIGHTAAAAPAPASPRAAAGASVMVLATRSLEEHRKVSESPPDQQPAAPAP